LLTDTEFDQDSKVQNSMKLSECTPKSAHRKSSGKNQALPTIIEIKNDLTKAIEDE